MSDSELVPVTQADREAAATLAELPTVRDLCLSGKFDGSRRVQALARHRIASTEALEAQVKALREALEAVLREFDHKDRNAGQTDALYAASVAIAHPGAPS